MKRLKIYLVVILSGLSFSSVAQGPYKLLLQGEPSPYDTAVAIQIKAYRAETYQLKLYDSLVRGLKKELSSKDNELKITDSLQQITNKEVLSLSNTVLRKDSVNQQILTNFNEFYQIATEPEKWYRDEKLWGLAGLIIGIIIAK